MTRPLHEQNEIILRDHVPTAAVRALLIEIRQQLGHAREALEIMNLADVRELIEQAQVLLPEDTDVHSLPWPTKEHFSQARGFGVRPEYQSIYDAENS